MGLFSFIKTAGKKIFGSKEAEAPEAERPQLKASALTGHIQSLGIPFQSLKIALRGDDVVVSGEVASQADAEKIVLALGNVEGVDTVESQLTVSVPAPESQYHTVVSGDSLSKIAKQYYGDMMRYPMIFEANQPMIKDPDEIYPGQVLRIPPL